VLCAGLVEVEEGELAGQHLSLRTHALARMSFAKEPHVQEVSGLSLLTAVHSFTWMIECVRLHNQRACVCVRVRVRETTFS